MKKQSSLFVLLFIFSTVFMLSCEKEVTKPVSRLHPEGTINTNELKAKDPKFNLEVVLKGEREKNGHIHFRQNPD